MIEIFMVIHFCRKLGALCRSRGRTAGWYQLLLVLGWFGGEFFTAMFTTVVCMIVSAVKDPLFDPDKFEPPLLIVYPAALLGAALGAWSVFLLVKLLPNLKEEEETIEDRTCAGCGEPLQRRATSCPLCGMRVAEA